ncbi:hypothetical protein LE181_24490 [Streptomyces sp. SCA3-4]|uniref:hypothetical protein n=1 Tax=Streptomyces sichuanensis TaxID=2871810 RepID=UPI001CE369FD|nr:hypothetical protein [Streptomyces sichuanensis]MCA6095311.1 hypothetical protein [Streptomyces sichuanensis]
MSEPAFAPPGAEHTISTSERGSFCTARCSCGWYGPARRARSLARDDAGMHLATATAAATATDGKVPGPRPAGPSGPSGGSTD